MNLKMCIHKRGYRLLLLQIILLFILSAFTTALTASAGITDFKTIIILGSGDKEDLTLRVESAFELIKAGNFQQVILSGGCVPPESDQNPETRTCPECGKGCTEAGEMEKLVGDLIEKENGWMAVGISTSFGVITEVQPKKSQKFVIYKEDKSTNTKSNYKNVLAMNLIHSDEKILLISTKEHVKAVSYCLRYKDNIDAYYFIHEKSDPLFNPYIAELIAIPQDSADDYGGIVAECKGTGSPTTSSSGLGPKYTTQKDPKNVPGCDSWQRCKEIDEIWVNWLSKKVNGQGISQAWDHNPPSGFKPIDNIYYEFTQVPVSGGYVAPGSSNLAGLYGGATLSTSGDSTKYDTLIHQAADRYGVKFVLIKAFMKHESGFDPNRVSSTGCTGLLQICGGSADPKFIRVQCNQKIGTEHSNPKQCDFPSCHDWKEDGTVQTNFGVPLQWCSPCSDYNCQPDDRTYPEKNIFSAVHEIQTKIQAVDSACAGKSCNEECKIKAYATQYNAGYVPAAIITVGNCDDWENVWQTWSKLPKVTAEFGPDKINNKRGTPSDYTGKIWLSYLSYKSSNLN